MGSVHNPTNFEPADYEVLDYLDNRRPAYYFGMPVEAYREEVMSWERGWQLALGDDWRAKAHRCVHCGNGNVRWVTVVLHRPSGERVVFGCDCTKRLGFEDKVAFRLALVQRRAEARDIRFKMFRERQEFLEAHPSIAQALEAIKQPVHAKNTFVQDVLAKLDKYGSLSDRQVAAVEQSLARDVQRAQQRAAEAQQPKGEAPTGRAEVTGTVLSLQERETDFGIVTKMLLQLENNSRAWMTAPRGGDYDRGDKIVVRATFERSKDDASFAFGARPTFVRKVQEEAA